MCLRVTVSLKQAKYRVIVSLKQAIYSGLFLVRPSSAAVPPSIDVSLGRFYLESPKQGSIPSDVTVRTQGERDAETLLPGRLENVSVRKSAHLLRRLIEKNTRLYTSLRASLEAQMVKNLPAMWETWV